MCIVCFCCLLQCLKYSVVGNVIGHCHLSTLAINWWPHAQSLFIVKWNMMFSQTEWKFLPEWVFQLPLIHLHLFMFFLLVLVHGSHAFVFFWLTLFPVFFPSVIKIGRLTDCLIYLIFSAHIFFNLFPLLAKPCSYRCKSEYTNLHLFAFLALELS